jgi:hypothetical protein
LQGFCLGEVRALIWQRKETTVSQVNVNPPEPRPTGSQVNVNEPVAGPFRDENTSTVATRNLTWALAMVIVVAVIAVALVYVLHGL